MDQMVSDLYVMSFLSRYPNQDLEIIKNTWRANVQEVEKKISIAEVDHSINNIKGICYVPVYLYICSAT